MVDGGDPGTRLEILDSISLPPLFPSFISFEKPHFLYYYHTEHDFFDAYNFFDANWLLLVGK